MRAGAGAPSAPGGSSRFVRVEAASSCSATGWAAQIYTETFGGDNGGWIDRTGIMNGDVANSPATFTGTALSGTLTAQPRPDVLPWAHAYVGGEWVPAAVTVVDRAFTLTAVAGAAEYHVRWMPVFTVFCDLPSEGLDSGSATFDWSFTAEEV